MISLNSSGTEEIESVFEMRLAIPLRRQVSPPVDEERLNLIGPSSAGRMISIVFTGRDGRVRPISGRDASLKERKLYEEVRKALEKL